ncbi:MAG: hypothetical protein LBR58_04995 [Propionibacteriaceae bacterium]|jgi:hypothetical protein|nr:hypothetical protein [Propionibacteriaceae bacterium]
MALDQQVEQARTLLKDAGNAAARDFTERYYALRKQANIICWLATAGVFVVIPALGFVLMHIGQWQYAERVLQMTPYLLILAPQYLLGVVAGIAIFVFAVVKARYHFICYQLCRYLDSDGLSDACPDARAAVSTQTTQAMFQLSAVGLGGLLLASGAIWAAVLFAAMATALDCAKSSKCM